MKNLVALLMLLSVGMFIVGCSEGTSAPSGNGGEADAPATDAAPADDATTPEAAVAPEGQPADDEDEEDEDE